MIRGSFNVAESPFKKEHFTYARTHGATSMSACIESDTWTSPGSITLLCTKVFDSFG